MEPLQAAAEPMRLTMHDSSENECRLCATIKNHARCTYTRARIFEDKSTVPGDKRDARVLAPERGRLLSFAPSLDLRRLPT